MAVVMEEILLNPNIMLTVTIMFIVDKNFGLIFRETIICI